DGEMDDAGVPAEHAAGFVHDVARLSGAGSQALDNVAIAPGGDEADVLAVLLLRDGKTEAARKLARLRFGHVAQRKAQELELLPGGGKQEIALVAVGVAGAIKRPVPTGQAPGRDIMGGGQHLGSEVAGGGKEVAELDGLIAFDAGHRGLPRRVAFGEAVDHRLLEAVLVVQDVMRDPDALSDRAGVMNVLPR